MVAFTSSVLVLAMVCTAMGAVASFLTPIGHHGNLLILGPGRYRFSDFLRVGFPLTVSIGLIGMVATLPLMQTPFMVALERLLAAFT